MNLRDEIAEQFNECMGYWEGIKVPDWDDGHSAVDYADHVLKLIENKIDSLKEQLDSNDDKMMISTLNWVKEMMMLKK